MKENKFTSGPWKVGFGYEQEIPGIYISSLANGRIVLAKDEEPTEDDANLIAAAPELLEALELCVGTLTGGLDGTWANDSSHTGKALAAIKKAHGESE